jgi:3-deoxy-D-manno-octulosonic-acid transferase
VFGLPALLLYFLGRGFRNRGYWRSLPQRFGWLPHSYKQTAPGAIWFHAVSVGEVLACAEALRGLRADFPNTAFFVSTSTLAGRALAGQKMKGLADGVFFAPVDYVFAVRRVLRALRPSVLVIAETEIWPNLIREARRTGAAVSIVNGRISDRALPRYRRFSWFFRATLPQVDSILAQTEEMRARFIELGAPPERVRAAGNLKYDFEARPAPPESPVRAVPSASRWPRGKWQPWGLRMRGAPRRVGPTPWSARVPLGPRDRMSVAAGRPGGRPQTRGSAPQLRRASYCSTQSAS